MIWVLTEDEVMALLRRVQAGEDPDQLYVEMYANSEEQGVSDG